MTDLHKALGDISSIRQQVAQSTEFRGYGPATLAGTAALAVLAAIAQFHFAPDPPHQIARYLAVWIVTALLAATLTAVQMVTRTRRMHSGLSNEMLGMAVEQFLPALGTGLVLILVMAHYVPAAVWMLPGLLQIVFALGVFASCRFLPRPMQIAGAWYLLTGMACVAFGQTSPLSPLLMGLPFGVGQMLIAAILFFAHKGDGYEA